MGVLEHVDQRGVAGQGGLELLGHAPGLGPRGAERGAVTRQLLLDLLLALGQRGELAAPGVLLVGSGLGQGQGGEPADDGLPLGGGTGDLGPGVGRKSRRRSRSRRCRSRMAPFQARTCR